MVLRADRVDVGEHAVLERVERRAVADGCAGDATATPAKARARQATASRRGDAA